MARAYKVINGQSATNEEELIMKKYTKQSYYEYLMTLLPESNFTLDTFNGTEQPCQITCLTCHNTHQFSAAALIARRARRQCKNVCKYCEQSIWARAQKEAEHKAIYILNKKQTIQLVGTIDSWGSKKPVLWKCTKCNHTFMRAPASMFNANILSCPWCESRPYMYTEQMIKEQVTELWGAEYTVLQVNDIQHNGTSRRIIVCHNKCGFKYSVNQWHFMHGQGCPHCKNNHGEWKVRNYLKKNNFYFQEQFLIHTRSGKNLKFDFYLEEGNNKYAIEYNGIQHYKPIEWFGGQKNFIAQQERDKEKTNYCLENGIILITIPYNDESIINSDKLAQRLRGQVTE